MLKKQYRLSTDYEFKITKKYGENVAAKFFYLYILKPQNYNGPTKVGIIVSNKFDKSSVHRNRIKRVYRDIVRKNLDKIKTGLWIIIYPRQDSQGAKYEDINFEFTNVLQKASIAG